MFSAEDSFFATPITVQWGDMDAGQHVNNTVYIRWFEISRIAFFQELVPQLNYGGQRPDDFILAEVSCRYLFPVTFPDVVEAACRFVPGSLSQHSFLMQQRISSRQHGRVVAEGTARLVTYNYQTLQKTPVSETLRQYLLTLKPTAT